jgi:hypothetical protein
VVRSCQFYSQCWQPLSISPVTFGICHAPGI